MSDSTPLVCRRSDFLLPDDVHYLNGAYMSPLSRRVVDAGLEGIRRKTQPHTIGETDFFTEVDRARELFAKLVNAGAPSRIAVVPSASYAMAQAVRNLEFEEGQNVVTIADVFPSTYYALDEKCRQTGAELSIVGPPGGAKGAGREWSQNVAAAIDESTAAVVVEPLHWMYGTLFDLEVVCNRAREVGATLIVDATQATGAMPLDVAALKPDMLVAAAYKWLTGPYSITFAYFSEKFDEGEPIERSWLTREGSDDFAGLTAYTDRYRNGAIRYDVGETSNFTLMPMAVAALEQVTGWQPGRIQEYCRSLTAPLYPELAEAGFALPDDADRAAHMVGIGLPSGLDPKRAASRLKENGVYASIRGPMLRLSVHVYNDERDVDALRSSLIELL